MAREKHTEFITKDILKSSVKGAFQKLDPRYMIKNPVMFVVEVGFFITLLLSIFPSMFGDGGELRIYNVIVTLILFVTILFANFAESVAEGRGKAQAETLKKTKKDTTARILDKAGNETVISASQLKKGDVVLVEAGELIPNDGEVIEGIASVDESAITGESAPVTREAGGDFSSVTGGTTVVSDWLKIRITSEPGQSFLDKMISLVEGASRQKTPNEIALNTLLVSLTIIFLIVVVTLHCFADYSQTRIPISTLIALLVCLIPTTIGGLLSAIGIAGMDRVTRFNVILLVIGMFMDITPAILIFTPIFLPIAESLGMSNIQFGVMLIFNMCMGNITPPVGSVLFVGCGISKISIEQVAKTLLPYFIVLFILLLAVTYIPVLSLGVPSLMGLL